jgi:mRNA interferase YafQ
MRTIDRSFVFRRDYKREAKGQHRATLDNDLKPVLVALATDQALDARCRDHDLSGDWAGYRECHIKPDLLLIYRKSDAGLGKVHSSNKSVCRPVRSNRTTSPDIL